MVLDRQWPQCRTTPIQKTTPTYSYRAFVARILAVCTCSETNGIVIPDQHHSLQWCFSDRFACGSQSSQSVAYRLTQNCIFVAQHRISISCPFDFAFIVAFPMYFGCLDYVLYVICPQGTLAEGSQVSLMPTGQVAKVDSIYINEER